MLIVTVLNTKPVYKGTDTKTEQEPAKLMYTLYKYVLPRLSVGGQSTMNTHNYVQGLRMHAAVNIIQIPWEKCECVCVCEKYMYVCMYIQHVHKNTHTNDIHNLLSMPTN